MIQSDKDKKVWPASSVSNFSLQKTISRRNLSTFDARRMEPHEFCETTAIWWIDALKTPKQDVRSIYGGKTVKSLKEANMKVLTRTRCSWFTCQTDLFWKTNSKILFLVLFWVTKLYVDPARYIHSEQTFILQLQQKKVKMWDVLPEATWKFETVSPTQWLTRAQICYSWETWEKNYDMITIYFLI